MEKLSIMRKENGEYCNIVSRKKKKIMQIITLNVEIMTSQNYEIKDEILKQKVKDYDLKSKLSY